MRICLTTTSNDEVIPFDYQQKLVGVLHKWLGKNELHDSISMYSFSWLMNGKMTTDGFNFENGASWFLSFLDEKNIKTVVKTILDDPNMFGGLVVCDVSIQEDVDLSQRSLFYVASPIFIKRKVDDNIKYYTYEDAEANQLMIDTINHKMELADLPIDEELKISFDLSYSKKKIKKVRIHKIDCKCNMCPVIIEGKESTKKFIWNVGVGSSTGVGFGSIY